VRQVEVKFIKMLKDSLSQSKAEYELLPLQWICEMPDGKQVDLRDGSDEKLGNDVAYEDRLRFARVALKARLMHSQA